MFLSILKNNCKLLAKISKSIRYKKYFYIEIVSKISIKVMNYIDIIISLYLAWGVYTGFKKGIIYMIVSLISVLLALYAAIHFSYLSTDYLAQLLHKDPEDLKILSYIVTFILVFVLMHLIGKILDKFIKAVSLGFVNRLGGAALSVAIKVVVMSLLLYVFDQGNQIFPIVSKETLNESTLYNPIKNLSPVILRNIDKLKHNQKFKDFRDKNFDLNKAKKQDTISANR